MPVFTTLIDVAELASHHNDPVWIIIDCRFDLADSEAGRRAYTRGHIPGARYAHLNDDLSSPITPVSGRHPMPDPVALGKKLGAWGVNASKQVVVYDDAGGAMAGRLWWLLRWLGHDAVALLNGGLKAWQAAGLRLSDKPPEVTQTEFQPQQKDELYVTSARVEQLRTDNNYRIVDARAPQRFSGEVEPLDKVAGHIPGAINMPWDNNVQTDGTFKSRDALRKQFEQQLGNVSPDHVIHSCGSGVTACHNIIAMEYAGLPGAKLYAGSWSEWISDPTRPVERS
jgi:thiosulfate/3-mercaptopyruvate sulfurtransferase